MSNTVDIYFLDSQTLGKPTSLESVVQVFADNGYETSRLNIDEGVLDLGQVSGDTIAILQAAYNSHYLSFTAFNPLSSFDVRQYVTWGKNRMGGEDRAYIRTTTDSTGPWRDGVDNAYYCSQLLMIGKGIYDVVNPSFGWIDVTHGNWDTTHEDIERIELPRIYWANFFGPRYVDHIGRSKILNAPAWKIEELADGGLLYLLAPHLGNTDEHVSKSAVREYFGVEQVR